MSLLDELRGLAGKIDGQFLPSSQEVGPLLGALIAHLEHGKALEKAAESDDPVEETTELLSGASKKPPGVEHEKAGKS